MKKIISVFISVFLMMALHAGIYAFDLPSNLNDMTIGELITLENQLEDAILSSAVMDGMVIPIGTYVVGEDISEGNYVITAKSEFSSPSIYISVYEADKQLEYYELKANDSCEISLTEGMNCKVDKSNSFKIEAWINTLTSYILENNTSIDTEDNYSDETKVELKAAEAIQSEVSSAETEDIETNTDSNNNVYTCIFDKWDLYKASLLGNSIKIDNYYRFNASDETPFKEDHFVAMYVIDDDGNDFQWLDEAHTAFTITFMDKDNVRFREAKKIMFTIGEDIPSYKGERVFTYLNDKWDLYKATLVGNTIKVENYYRFNASDGNPFELNYYVGTYEIDDYQWTDDTHKYFIVSLEDESNSHLSGKTQVVFEYED